MELGSEFSLALEDLTYKKTNIYHYLSKFAQVIWFDSGRSALRHIASHIDEESEVLLPEFICESVWKAFEKHKIVFYKINEDFTIDADDLRQKMKPETQIVFLMHYFGMVQPIHVLREIRKISDENHCVIVEDTTHSIFSKTCTIGDYAICSIRKWMPVPKCGALYCADDKLHLNNETKYKMDWDNERAYGMILKELFLKHGLDCNSFYRKMFAECENRLDLQTDILLLSDFSRYLLSCFDIENLIFARKKNYNILKEELAPTGIMPAIDLKEEEVPLVFPIRIPKRDYFREYLMDNQIYCAVHWKFDGFQGQMRPGAKINGDEMISLPIDQRYGEEHIRFMAGVIKKYGGDMSYWR